MKEKPYVKWTRPYYRARDAKAITKKRAIKIIMAATCCGDRHWAGDVFAYAKRQLAGNPSNADACYRVMCYIYNVTNYPVFDTTALRAHSIAMRLRGLYGPNVGGTLIDETEDGNDATTD